jgi:amino acid permease
VFVIFFVGYKFWKKTKFVDLLDIDLQSGRRPEIPEEMKVKTDSKYPWMLKFRRAFVG